MSSSYLERLRLLENLQSRTYCRLGVSSLSGIGVIAIKKVPPNIDPFQTVYRLETVSIELSPKEVELLDPGVSTLVKDFFMRTPNNMYPVYFNGLNALDIAYYLNHSENPNVMMVNEPSNLISERDQFDLMQTSELVDPRELDGGDGVEGGEGVEGGDGGGEEEIYAENSLSEYYTFRTIRAIRVGEELTINYYQHATSLKEVNAIKKQFQLP